MRPLPLRLSPPAHLHALDLARDDGRDVRVVHGLDVGATPEEGVDVGEDVHGDGEYEVSMGVIGMV